MRRARRARAAAMTALLGAALLALAGCSSVLAGSPRPIGSLDQDRGLVEGYFTELNAAGDEGAATQREYLRRTQHPDFADQLCDLGDLTLHVEPAMSTLRVDPDWVPPDSGDDGSGGERPRGLIYVIGVSIAIRQDGALLGEQIGSQRVVVLDGRAYGFAPCPTG